MIKKRSPRPELQKQLQSGFDALRANDPETAANVCQEVLAKAPDMPRAHFLAGLIALESGHRVTAEAAFENTVRLQKNYAAAWARLAHLYATSGRIRMAEAALLNAANSQRDNPATDQFADLNHKLSQPPGVFQGLHERTMTQFNIENNCLGASCNFLAHHR